MAKYQHPRPKSVTGSTPFRTKVDGTRPAALEPSSSAISSRMARTRRGHQGSDEPGLGPDNRIRDDHGPRLS